MKKKDIIASIKQSALDEMPDVIHKIDISKIIIEPAVSTERPKLNFYKAFSYTFASLFILVSGLLAFNIISIGTDNTPLNSNTEIVGFQTVSGAALLDSFNKMDELSFNSDNLYIVELSTTTSVQTPDDSIIDQIDTINHYLNMAETVLVNEKQYLYESMESDNPDYQYAYQYNGTDLLGNLITYYGYYNIIETNNNQTEQGILIHNDTTFHYTSISIENGINSFYHYHIYVNESDFVEVINQSNNKVQKFQYNVYRNNQLTNTSTITITSIQNRLLAKINITNQNNQEITLNLERNMSNISNQSFQVNYIINDSRNYSEGRFNVNLDYDNTTDTYHFRYDINDSVIVIEARENKGYHKATEDDFKPTHTHTPRNPFVTTVEDTTTEDTDNNPNSSGNQGHKKQQTSDSSDGSFDNAWIKIIFKNKIEI